MKIETEITGSLVKKVSMLSGDQKPGIELPPQEVTDTKTCETKITESKLHGGEITPGSKISKVENDGVKSPGSNIVGGHKSEGGTSEGNNPGDKPPGSEGSNAGRTNGPVRESDQRGEVKLKWMWIQFRAHLVKRVQTVSLGQQDVLRMKAMHHPLFRRVRQAE